MSDYNFKTEWKLEVKWREDAERRIKELEKLLNAAVCPCCDGDGAYWDNMGEVCQCQFCDDRSKLLKHKSKP